MNDLSITADSGVDGKSADIAIINPLKDERWGRFISKHPDAVFFHQPKWLKVLKEQYSYKPFCICIVNDNGEISAGIPFCEIGKVAKVKWISLPFSDYCNPLYYNDSQLDILLKGIIECYIRGKVDFIGLGYDISGMCGFKSKCGAVLHIADVLDSEDKMLKTFDRSKRQGINKSFKEGLKFETARSYNAIERFYKLHLKTRKKLGVPIQPKGFFKKLYEEFFLDNDEGLIIIITKDKIDLAAGFFLGYNKKLVYKYNASDPGYLHLRPNNLIIWAAIQEAIKMEYRYFDFGKSDFENEGLRKFKSGWGAKETLLAFSYFPKIPGKNIFTAVNNRMVHPMIKHSPPFVCRLLGEVGYKYFPM